MTNAALEMERSYRQYCVLTTLRLRRFIKASASVTAKCSMPTQACCRTINSTSITSGFEQSGFNFSVTTAVLMLLPPRVWKPLPVPIPKWCRPRAQWCSRGQQLQREIAERGQYFGWQSLVLFLVSLVMVLLFTRMIIGPVKISSA